jgi:hypothetical protein
MVGNMILNAANAASFVFCHSVEGRNTKSLYAINVALKTAPLSPFCGAPIQIYISRAFMSALRPPQTSGKWAAFILILLRNVTPVYHVRPFPHIHTYECVRVYMCIHSFFNYIFEFMKNGRTGRTRPCWMRKMVGRFGRTRQDMADAIGTF